MRLRHTDRKKQLLEISLKIIHERGFTALTIKEITNQAKISEPAFYRHFENKDSLIIQILEKMDELEEAILENLSKNCNCKDKLIEFACSHFDFFENNPEMITVMLADDFLKFSEPVIAKLTQIRINRMNIIKEIFKNCQYPECKEILVEELEYVPIFFLGSIRLILINWKKENQAFPLKEYGRKAIESLIRLITKKKEK